MSQQCSATLLYIAARVQRSSSIGVAWLLRDDDCLCIIPFYVLHCAAAARLRHYALCYYVYVHGRMKRQVDTVVV